MATEPFLINPYKIRDRRRVRYDDNPRGLPPRLLSRMMRKYGPPRGMREAWAAYRKGVTRNEPELFDNTKFGGSLGRRGTALKGWRARRIIGRNPLGEEVMIVGSNPRRKRRSRRRRARARRRIPGFLARLFGRGITRRARRRRRARGLGSYVGKARSRRRRAARFRDNPARRSKAIALRAPGLPDVSRPASLLMPAIVGTAAYIATDKVPSMVNVTSTLPRLGVKAAVGFGGGILISRFLGRNQGAVWAIGSSINILSDILRTYVFKTSPVAGLAAFPRRGVSYSGLGAYTSEYELSGYPM